MDSSNSETSESDSDLYLSNNESESDSDNDDEPDYDVNPPVWSIQTSGMRPIQFIKEEKFRIPLPNEGKPIDFFNILVDDIFLENIVKYTNKNVIRVFLNSDKLTPKSRVNKWKDITVPELKTFLALMLHTGTIKLPRINDYWKTHWLYGPQCFSKYMSRDRFLLILRCIYFSDENYLNVGNERLRKIQPVIDYFNNKMLNVFYPQQQLSLDESMLLWRGRLLFRQYIKGKKHKYGIKLYTLSDPHGLILKFMVYSGTFDNLSGKGHTTNVVLSLMKEKLGNGHSLFMDNYYNSFVLASKLLANKTYCTGTLRINRKFTPDEVKSANIKPGETVARYSEGVLIGKWKDKRVVPYLSTEFDNEIVESINRRGQSKMKPLPIVKYNAFMKGVDRGDMMMAYYPAERKTLRWYKKLFFHTLHMLLMNSYQLYNKYLFGKGEARMSFYDFRISVLEKLLPKEENLRLEMPLAGPIHSLTKLGLKGNSNRTKQKDCRVCRMNQVRKLTRFVCETCVGSPGLCPGACFDFYHRHQ